MPLKLIGALALLAIGVASVAEAKDRTVRTDRAFLFCTLAPVNSGNVELTTAKLEVPHHYPRVGVLCSFSLSDGYLLRGTYPVQVHVPVSYSASQSSLSWIYRRTFMTEHDDIWRRCDGLRAPYDEYSGQDCTHAHSPWLDSLQFPKKPPQHQAKVCA